MSDIVIWWFDSLAQLDRCEIMINKYNANTNISRLHSSDHHAIPRFIRIQANEITIVIWFKLNLFFHFFIT